ncbi:MAG: carboxypeptidase regulatory-like domain-containing protein [Armatimonadetes bacterium]|nr:carboxypeptidase regulatory-like domain-containing protein [Armatimonadota bacterium]MCX7968138.1 carboxypeptidase regulatory-like domain-containing protein [Armatimonadota bacterium]MDW8142027.1 carboxypeptidase regulatory-like domain-containing protein [Armatimonadota bacterium]
MTRKEVGEKNRVRAATLATLGTCALVVFPLLLSLLGCGGLELPGLIVPTVQVSGTVFEAGLLEDKPIANAWVVINGSAPAYTDSSGRFTVNVPITSTSNQTILVAISVAKHGYLARLIEDRQINTGSSTELDPIYLVPSPNTSGLKGRVVDKTTGRGVPNAEVILHGDLTLRVRTAADGSFLLSGIMPESGEVTLQARHPDFLTVFDLQTGRNRQPVIIRKGDENVNTIILELYPLGTPTRISGRVVNSETSEPVPNATVTLGNKRAVTDGNGDFSIPDAPTGLQTLRVEHPQFLTFSENLLINGDPLHIFLLVPGTLPSLPFTIAGKVTLQGETNHSGVRVEARRKVDGVVVDVATTTIDGNYSLWVPPGTYLVRASIDGFVSAEREVVVRKGVAVTNVNFTLVRLEGSQ